MLHRLTIMLGLVVALVGASFAVANGAPAGRRSPATPSVQMGYYDGHLDAYVSTDASTRAVATEMNVQYSPNLVAIKLKRLPSIYMVTGTAASGQLAIFGSEPGESTYSPIWRDVEVTWESGATPVLLTSDTQIDQLAAAGQLTEMRTKVRVNCPVIAVDVAAGSTVAALPVFQTFYDGHEDGMLATDVSTEAKATAAHINYSPVLATLDPELFPEIYIVRGAMATGQLNVLGSEPGEANYSPLWRETIVHWRRGVTPTVIKSDTQIDRLVAAGKVFERGTTVVLNCPVVGESATIPTPTPAPYPAVDRIVKERP